MATKLITILLALFIFLLVVELTRKEKLTFKYAFGWLIVSFLAIVLTIFDQFLFAFAYFVGFELPSNFIFFTLLTGLVFLSLVMTVFLCRQENRNNAMAQKISLLENEIESLKDDR